MSPAERQIMSDLVVTARLFLDALYAPRLSLSPDPRRTDEQQRARTRLADALHMFDAALEHAQEILRDE